MKKIKLHMFLDDMFWIGLALVPVVFFGLCIIGISWKLISFML